MFMRVFPQENVPKILSILRLLSPWWIWPRPYSVWNVHFQLVFQKPVSFGTCVKETEKMLSSPGYETLTAFSHWWVRQGCADVSVETAFERLVLKSERFVFESSLTGIVSQLKPVSHWFESCILRVHIRFRSKSHRLSSWVEWNFTNEEIFLPFFVNSKIHLTEYLFAQWNRVLRVFPWRMLHFRKRIKMHLISFDELFLPALCSQIMKLVAVISNLVHF